MKYNKESYITDRIDPKLWKQHVNVQTLNEFRNYIKGSVLDVGCNHGGTTYWVKDFNVSSVSGIDINNESLSYAKNVFQDVPIPSEFYYMDLTKERLNKQFDTIICFHTIEHIYEEDIDKFLTNVYHMLDDQGFLLVGLPYKHSYPDPCHVMFYDESKLEEVMKRNKFNVLYCFEDNRWEEKNILTGLFSKI